MKKPAISLELLKKPGLTLNQKMRLMLTHEMKQAIHYLQLPILELQQEMEAELEQNPVIDCINEQEASADPDLESMELAVKEKEEEIEKNYEELQFNDRDFEVLKQLDEEYKSSLGQETKCAKKTQEDEKKQTFIEQSITADETLFEHLMKEARETFENSQELEIAEKLIGHFDERGFLETPLEEIALLYQLDLEEVKRILNRIQTFEPLGVGAYDLKESLLIQLRGQKQADSLSYQMIARHYEDLTHHRLPAIKKGLGCSLDEIENAIETQIKKLDLQPGKSYSQRPTPYIIPDAMIKFDGEKLIPEVNEESLPSIRLNTRYLRMLEVPGLKDEAKEFLKEKIMKAKWLLKNVHHRNETLFKILQELIKRQNEFLLNPAGKLVPMSMQDLIEEVGVHESTLARTVANKYVDTPRGLLPLRSFFTVGYQTEEGNDISSRTILDVIQEIINSEDKSKPFSDEKIAAILKERKMPCARRTIAKYRGILRLGNAQQRRKYSGR